jgi:hypothetical protein
MTKIKSSYSLNADLNNAIGRLATQLGQSNSQLVENILRENEHLRKLAYEFALAKEMPDYELKEKNKHIPA